VITISESARADLTRLYGLPATRLAVTPLAADSRFRPRPAAEVAANRARYGLPERYVLYVGSNKPHKNLPALVQAWEHVRGREPGGALVIAGHVDRKHPELRRLLAARGLGDSVRLLPNVADADLPALYSGATVFAFPSRYEGFGLPPLEAMACGAPVLCARTSSLPEVVGDAALTYDPDSPGELAAELGRLVADPELRRDLSRRGQRRARDYSWRRTALGTLRVYEGLERR
jgi:alpha-1,3-rhamnosyl/mannosyltransferase